MTPFLEVADLLRQPLGNLGYRIVLLLACVASALVAGQTSRSARRAARPQPGGWQALAVASLVLAGGQAVALALSASDWAPPLERAVSTLMVGLFVLALASPLSRRLTVVAASLLMVVTLAGLTASLVVSPLSRLPAYNGSPADLLWLLAQVGVLAGGLVVTLALRRTGWLAGSGLLAVLLAGQALHYAFPLGNLDVPVTVRLAELLVWPLLVLWLARRLYALRPRPGTVTHTSSSLERPKPAASRDLTPFDRPVSGGPLLTKRPRRARPRPVFQAGDQRRRVAPGGLRAAQKSASDETAALHTAMAQLRAELAQAQDEATRMRADRETAGTQANAAMQGLTERLRTAQADLRWLSQELAQAQQATEEWRRQAEAETQTASTLQAERAALYVRLAEARAELEQHAERQSALEIQAEAERQQYAQALAELHGHADTQARQHAQRYMQFRAQAEAQFRQDSQQRVQLQSQVAALTDQATQIRTALQMAQADTAAARAALAQANADRSQLMKNLDGLTQTLRASEQRAASLAAHGEQDALERQALAEARIAAEQNAARLEAALAETHSAAEHSSAQLRAALAEAQRNAEQTEAQLGAALEEARSTSEHALAQLHTKLEEAQTQGEQETAQLRAELEDARTRVLEDEGRLRAALEAQSAAQRETTSLRATLAEAQHSAEREIAQARAALVEAQTSAEETSAQLRADLEQAQSGSGHTTAQLRAELEAMRAAAQLESEHHQSALNELNSALVEAHAQRDRLRASLDNLQDQLQQREQRVATLTAQAEARAHQERADQERAVHERLQREQHHIQALGAAQSEAARLRASLAQAQAERDAARGELTAAANELKAAYAPASRASEQSAAPGEPSTGPVAEPLPGEADASIESNGHRLEQTQTQVSQAVSNAAERDTASRSQPGEAAPAMPPPDTLERVAFDDQSLLGSAEQSCPHLGLVTDRDTRHAFSSEMNRCYALDGAAKVSVSHQNGFCLGSSHASCPVFTGSVKHPRLPIDTDEEARSGRGGKRRLVPFLGRGKSEKN